MSPGSGVLKSPHQRPVLWLAAGPGTEPRQAGAPGTVQPSVECWRKVGDGVWDSSPTTSTLPVGLPCPHQLRLLGRRGGGDQPARCPRAGWAQGPCGQTEHCGVAASGWREVSAGSGLSREGTRLCLGFRHRKHHQEERGQTALRHCSQPCRSPPRAGQGFKVYKFSTGYLLSYKVV